MRALRKTRAVSSIEAMFLIAVILLALITFGGYIQRALAGRWKSAGDTFGQGRQYDPRSFGVNGTSGGTMDCYYDHFRGRWIDESLYRSNNCDCTLKRADGGELPEYATRCTACIANSLCAHPPM